MNWKEKSFLVFGLGLSGIGAAKLLVKEQVNVSLFDGNRELDIKALREKNPALGDIPVTLGDLTEETLSQTDIVVLSPGVPTDLPIVNRMRERGIEIWGEIELAYVLGRGRVLAITGTNGKTTTTALLGEILKNTYKDVRVVGNIGIPYTQVAGETTEDSVIVAEISSFQLETIHSFCPQVSAILNITPDHMDRHHTMENYIAAKERITENQGAAETCVLNYEDEVLRSFGPTLKGNVIWFSSARRLEHGLYLAGDEIRYAKEGREVLLCNTKELALIGMHNYENVMAAAAMAISFEVPFHIIRKALKEFHGVEHRIEYVTEKRGVKFYNDSKGTNPDAAIKAICAMQRPTLLIGGGYDKGSQYEAWIESFDDKVKKLVLLGATREKIADAAMACGFPKEDIVFVENLKEAVTVCYANAESGDAVLLSPACASWGMFANYEERGRMFKELIQKLEE